MVKERVCFDKIDVLLLLGVFFKNKGEDWDFGCDYFRLFCRLIGGSRGWLI